VKNQRERRIDALCPRCGFLLVPVHDAGDRARNVRSYCCPDPYCDYTMQAPVRPPRRRGFWTSRDEPPRARSPQGEPAA